MIMATNVSGDSPGEVHPRYCKVAICADRVVGSRDAVPWAFRVAEPTVHVQNRQRLIAATAPGESGLVVSAGSISWRWSFSCLSGR